MIITKTPFRISFAGGGTDLPSFYKEEPGAVVSAAIDKYMYIMVNKRFDRTIRVSYSKTEIVADVADIRHDLVREALKSLNIHEGIEITSIADLPGSAGMGSSSSFTVGLLNALYAYLGVKKGARELAQEACAIEIDVLKEPIGKQDQYAAAFGGINFMRFMPDEKVILEPLCGDKAMKDKLNDSLMLFYVSERGDSRDVLQHLKVLNADARGVLRKIAALAIELKGTFNNGGDISAFGEIMDRGWRLKRGLTPLISNHNIDNIYERAMKAGALGGKLLGAGGGGFLLFSVDQTKQKAVLSALRDLRCLPFRFEDQGSHIVFEEE